MSYVFQLTYQYICSCPVLFFYFHLYYFTKQKVKINHPHFSSILIFVIFWLLIEYRTYFLKMFIVYLQYSYIFNIEWDAILIIFVIHTTNKYCSILIFLRPSTVKYLSERCFGRFLKYNVLGCYSIAVTYSLIVFVKTGKIFKIASYSRNFYGHLNFWGTEYSQNVYDDGTNQSSKMNVLKNFLK